jgi:hypothetical protein
MRLLSDKKGQVRIIEAFFASVLLLSVLTMIPQPTTKTTQPNLSSTATNVLVNLDKNGYLASLIETRNWNTIENCVRSLLPLTGWFNLTVFDENMKVINDQPICSGSLVSDNIAAVEYVCATTSSSFAVYIVRLQLACVE